jgi:hypothetical protein
MQRWIVILLTGILISIFALIPVARSQDTTANRFQIVAASSPASSASPGLSGVWAISTNSGTLSYCQVVPSSVPSAPSAPSAPGDASRGKIRCSATIRVPN